ASWSNFLGIFQIFPSTQTEQNLGHFTAPNTPVPFASNLEQLYIPDATRIMEEADELIFDLKK
ncbi:hypothetical protein L3H37_00005, partial [Corynebacterium sp. MC-20]|nr:hypothetical protein [Corynebacterium parakroppenstedtii]